MSKDIREFTGLLEPLYNDAVKYSKALCAGWSPDDAEDVLQQSLLLAMENFGSLRDTSKFRSWFFKIITTTFYTSIRKHFWKKFLPLDDNPNVASMPEVYDRTESNDNKLILSKALARLNSKERAAILLFEIADFSIEEIRIIQQEKSLSAVKSRLSRARAKLKKYIIQQENFLTQNEASREYPGDFTGDIENETLKLISEIRIER
ncbi:MAG: RNA polymerase sigma factor [Ignavibacteria bacterium]|nr:RNA polymerase sigma factor [Ignavibacteria bacterium]